MVNGYGNMSVFELTALLKQTQEKIADIEDERDIRLSQSQSGQHTGSTIIQSRMQNINTELSSLQKSVREITDTLAAMSKAPAARRRLQECGSLL
jgi:flagellar biosynthesis chaperone FliJ